MDLLYFIILISALIFVHESGHFAFAKIFGVKVLTFSIGFGPKILRLRGKETEYCIGLFPFGGFVKMLEESKRAEPLLPEERHRTFESQSLWKRIVIVLAGPAMNLVFPIVLFTSVFLEEREFLPPTVGVVVPGKPAHGKLKPGDRILSVQGTPVTSFPEVQRVLAGHANVPVRLVVQREAKAVDVTVTPADEVDTHELDIEEHVGRIGISPRFPAAVVGVRHRSPGWAAGIRTFDRVTAINGRKIETMLDLVTALSANKGETVVLTYLRPVPVPTAMGGLVDLALMEPGVAQLTPTARPPEGAPAPDDSEARAADVLERCGIESSDLHVAVVPEGSSEWLAGLRPGDRILSLDGNPQTMWVVMNEQLVREADRTHVITWSRDGQESSGSFKLRRERWKDDAGEHEEPRVTMAHWVPMAKDHTVPNPSRVLGSLSRAFEATWRVIRLTAITMLRILQGRVGLSGMSGPITVYDIAAEAGARGTSDFVKAMAFISVELGLMNLLPIPVLDGGHLLFFVVEGVRRRPLSLRVREVASLIGMVFLVFLMAVAFKNDVTRKWDIIVTQVREIVS